ncbi:Nn.00g056490.m01.CDS01 [Neocucurbitaria sp. VM-36]
MRFSAVSVAVLAGVVAAAPQVQPISQISDGQIQAPTAVPSVYSSAVVPVVSTPEVVSTPAAVSTPAEATATPIVPTSLVVPIVPGVNSTAIVPSSTGAVASSSAPSAGSSGSATTSASVPEQSTGAAAGTAISFGGLVFAMAAAVFA